MTLKTSLVLFSDLKNLCSLIDLGSLCNLNGLNSLYSPIYSKKNPDPDGLIITGTNTGHFCGMDHQKSNFSLIYGTLSDGGYWGQPMLLFQKLGDETLMPKPQEYPDTFILSKKLFLVGLWSLQSMYIKSGRKTLYSFLFLAAWYCFIVGLPTFWYNLFKKPQFWYSARCIKSD